MKKTILTALAVFAFGFTNAQEVKFGVKAGLNFSNWTGDTEGVDLKSKVGLNAGAFAEIKFSEIFSLQPEVLFSSQGTKVDNFETNIDGVDYTGDVKFNLSYINIPVMFKYYVDEKFNVEAGPQIGFLASAKTATKLEGYSQTVNEDVKDSFESVDFGLNLGLGYDFTDHCFAVVRYNLGLSNIAKTEAEDDSKINNSVLSFFIGYKF